MPNSAAEMLRPKAATAYLDMCRQTRAWPATNRGGPHHVRHASRTAITEPKSFGQIPVSRPSLSTTVALETASAIGPPLQAGALRIEELSEICSSADRPWVRYHAA